ncbi:MAG TPA: hypothetical protein PLD15_05025, partial [Mesotoga sp.]|nr:hypothetical protein [Mesotoga sp.]
ASPGHYSYSVVPYGGMEGFFEGKDVLMAGYVEYDNDPGRRIAFKVLMSEGIGIIADGHSPLFSAF